MGECRPCVPHLRRTPHQGTSIPGGKLPLHVFPLLDIHCRRRIVMGWQVGSGGTRGAHRQAQPPLFGRHFRQQDCRQLARQGRRAGHQNPVGCLYVGVPAAGVWAQLRHIVSKTVAWIPPCCVWPACLPFTCCLLALAHPSRENTANRSAGAAQLITVPDTLPYPCVPQDFCAKLLSFAPDDRPTAEEALQHEWIMEVRNAARAREPYHI